MFNEIAKKIKLISQIVCWGGVGVDIIIALIMFSKSNDAYIEGPYKILGYLFLFFVPIFPFVWGFILYGLGELIEKVSGGKKETKKTTEQQDKKEAQRVRELEMLRAQGLITEEEFYNALNNNKGRTV